MFPFLRQGNRGSGRVGDFATVTQLLAGSFLQPRCTTSKNRSYIDGDVGLYTGYLSSLNVMISTDPQDGILTPIRGEEIEAQINGTLYQQHIVNKSENLIQGKIGHPALQVDCDDSVYLTHTVLCRHGKGIHRKPKAVSTSTNYTPLSLTQSRFPQLDLQKEPVAFMKYSSASLFCTHYRMISPSPQRKGGAL